MGLAPTEEPDLFTAHYELDLRRREAQIREESDKLDYQYHLHEARVSILSDRLDAIREREEKVAERERAVEVREQQIAVELDRMHAIKVSLAKLLDTKDV